MYPLISQQSSFPFSVNPSAPPMSVSGIQGQLLEVTVVGCTKLKDTEWISRQDPYVCVEYGGKKCRTRTCTDGGRNPTFQEKFVFSLIEGLRELNVAVWNSNTLSYDDFIGSGNVQLHKVLSEGFDDGTWPLLSKTGRAAGELRLILHYANAKKAATSFAPSAPPYAAPVPQLPTNPAPPPAYPTPYAPPAYPTPYAPPAYPTPYAPPASAYPTPSPYPSYPPTSTYPPSAYPPPPQATAYPPPPYPPPTSTYPPPPYPPPPAYPPGPYPGTYPPPY